jgi:hypothetical protein
MQRQAIVLIAVFLLAAGCDSRASGDEKHASRSEKKNDHERGGGNSPGGRPKFKLGRIDHKAVTESSGLAASRKHPGVYWTHNDSGNGAFVFAITREGSFLAEYPVATVRNNDWEAVATDDQGHLYIADIGNNDLKRDRAIVYRLDEPDPAAAGAKGKGPPLRVNQVWRLKYPDKPFDAESLFIHRGKGYVVSKLLNGRNAGLYRFDLASAGADAATLEHVCDLPIRSPVTDASVSPDGKRLAVLSVTGPNVFQIDGDVANAAKVQPAHVTYFDPGDMNMEGVCFTDGGLLASTEQGQMLFFEDKYFDSAR